MVVTRVNLRFFI